MSIDYQSLLYDPLYDVMGIDATLTILGDEPVELTVMNKTAGVPVAGDSGIDVETIRPACDVRVAELTAAGLEREDLDDATVEFGGKVWRIKATLPLPSGASEADGELRLILTEDE